MPSSYGNIAVKGVERAALTAWLGGRKLAAWVGPEERGWIAFTDPVTDGFRLAEASETMVALTGDLGCVAIAAAMHEGDVLGLIAADNGRHVASYISYPGIFDETQPTTRDKPEIMGAAGMLAVLGGGDEAALRRVLQVGTAEQFVYPLTLHKDFVTAFGLPAYTLALSFRAAEAGKLPGEAFLRVG